MKDFIELSAMGNVQLHAWLRVLGFGPDHVPEIDIVSGNMVLWKPKRGNVPVPILTIHDGSPPALTDESLSQVLELLSQYELARQLVPVAAYIRVAGDHAQLRALGESLGERLMLAVAFLHNATGIDWQVLLKLLSSGIAQEKFETAGAIVRRDTDLVEAAFLELQSAVAKQELDKAHKQRTVKDPQEDAPSTQRGE